MAVELGGGIVWVALVVVFGRFGLTLLEGVDEIGLGDGLEAEKRNAERGGGGVKAEVPFPATFFVGIVARSLQTGTRRVKRVKTARKVREEVG